MKRIAIHSDRKPGANVLARYEAMSKAMLSCNGVGVSIAHQRQQKYLWPRVVIAHALYKEGFLEREIAYVMNRDRSTVCYYKGLMAAALEYPNMYPEAIELSKTFKSKLYGN